MSSESLMRYREELIENELSERLFCVISKLAAYKEDISMPERTSSREPLHSAPLQLAKCIIHFLALDAPLAQAIDKVVLFCVLTFFLYSNIDYNGQRCFESPSQFVKKMTRH